MKRTATVVVSLLGGALVGLLLTAALTGLLAPYLWPAPLVALPVAVVLGVWTAGFVYVWLTARAERRETGTATARTSRRLRGLAGALAGLLLVGGLAGAFTYASAGGIAAATFTGVPVGVVGALVAGYLATRTGGGSLEH
jgi:hypothetical protein